MTMFERMKARAALLTALQEAIPLDPQDGRLVNLAAAIEDMIDTKLDEAIQPVRNR